MSRQNLHSQSAYQMQTNVVSAGGTCLICANTEGDILGPILVGTSGQWQDQECSYLPGKHFLKKWGKEITGCREPITLYTHQLVTNFS